MMAYYNIRGGNYYTTTIASSTTGTFMVGGVGWDMRAPEKKTLLDLLEERVEGVCAVGRERLAA